MSITHVSHIFSIHSPVDIHIGCFCVLPRVNKAAGNTEEQILLWDNDFLSFGSIPRSEIAESYGRSIFNLSNVLYILYYLLYILYIYILYVIIYYIFIYMMPLVTAVPVDPSGELRGKRKAVSSLRCRKPWMSRGRRKSWLFSPGLGKAGFLEWWSHSVRSNRQIAPRGLMTAPLELGLLFGFPARAGWCLAVQGRSPGFSGLPCMPSPDVWGWGHLSGSHSSLHKRAYLPAIVRSFGRSKSHEVRFACAEPWPVTESLGFAFPS